MKWMSVYCVAALFAGYAVIATAADNTAFQEVSRIDNSSSDIRYGWSNLDAAGDILVVGNPYDDTRGDAAGAAYVFSRTASGWKLRQTLAPPSLSGSDFFGGYIAVEGDVLAVSESRFNAEGLLYLFKRGEDGWQQSQRLTATLARDSRDSLGRAMAIDGDFLVASSEGIRSSEVSPYNNHQLLHVFSRGENGWQETAFMAGDYDSMYSEFGLSVAISGNTIVAGDPKEWVDGKSAAGAVYVFEFNGSQWDRVAKLIPADSNHERYFGRSVAISEDAILVGAPGGMMGEGSIRIPQAENLGSAYLFTRVNGEWRESQKFELELDQSDYRDLFGYNVELDGELAVVTAPVRYIDHPAGGSVHFYRKTALGWVAAEEFRGEHSSAYLGLETAISGNSVFTGAADVLVEYAINTVVTEPDAPVIQDGLTTQRPVADAVEMPQSVAVVTTRIDDETPAAGGGSLDVVVLSLLAGLRRQAGRRHQIQAG